MKILALEFSSEQRGVAVLESHPNLPPAVIGTAVESGARRRMALALVEQGLREAGVDREQIQLLAIGLGPGSYAGIRSAIALAQGWQLARPVNLLGISSAECLAAQAQAENIFGRINIVIDAQRNEFYLAAYEIDATSLREIEALHLVAVDEVQTRFRANQIVLGPQITQWLPGGRRLFPTAAILGRLAANRTDSVSGEKLEPIYLRETNFVKAPPPRLIPGI